MTPTFRIIADGADITELINDRLLLLRTTDKPGMESDDFELRIDDRDSAVSLPSRWESVSLASIVSDVAARKGWSPICPVTTTVPRADQLSESDFNFITRLARQYDCTAKVADGRLLVLCQCQLRADSGGAGQTHCPGAMAGSQRPSPLPSPDRLTNPTSTPA